MPHSDLFELKEEHPSPHYLKPMGDMHENVDTNTVTVIFELPGVKKSDIKVEVIDGRISVSGEVKVPQEYNGSNYITQERKFGRFWGRWHLPMGVPAVDVRVSLEDGVLTITYPMSGSSLPKVINIEK